MKPEVDAPTSDKPALPPLWRRIVQSKVLYTLIALCVAGYFLLHWIQSIGGPEEFRRRFGWQAPLITVPVQALVAVSPFPSDVLCVINGVLYGFYLGAGLNWLGWYIASLIEFGLGRRAAKDIDLASVQDKLPRWLRRFPYSSPWFLILGRLAPYIGGHVTTFIPGAAGVSWTRFAWCSAIAIIPAAVAWAFVGTQYGTMWNWLTTWF